MTNHVKDDRQLMNSKSGKMMMMKEHHITMMER
jgi:hypothetical protein